MLKYKHIKYLSIEIIHGGIIEKGLSDFIKLAYKYNKVKDVSEAFKDFPVNKEWHKGKIENILIDKKQKLLKIRKDNIE